MYIVRLHHKRCLYSLKEKSEVVLGCGPYASPQWWQSRYEEKKIKIPSFLLFTSVKSSLVTSPVSNIHSLVFFALHDTLNICRILSSQRPECATCLFYSWCPCFHTRMLQLATLMLFKRRTFVVMQMLWLLREMLSSLINRVISDALLDTADCTQRHFEHLFYYACRKFH